MTAKVFSQPSCWLCRLIHNQLDGGVAAHRSVARLGEVFGWTQRLTEQ
jgi:hypothetical protein